MIDKQELLQKFTAMEKKDYLNQYAYFNEHYSIDALQQINLSELAIRLFSNSKDNPGVFYWFVGTKNNPAPLGTKNLDTNKGIKYTNGKYERILPNNKKTVLSNSDVEIIAGELLQALQDTCLLLEKATLNAFKDYEDIYTQIQGILKDALPKETKSNWYWNSEGCPGDLIIKYYHCSFPEKFSCTYSAKATGNIAVQLLGADICADSPFVRNGQIRLYAKGLSIPSASFEELLNTAELYKDEQHFYICSAKPEEYDHKGSFNEKGYIDWSNFPKGVANGDTVYIYKSQNSSDVNDNGRIWFKTTVTQINIQETEEKDDHFSKGALKSSPPYVRLGLPIETSSENLSNTRLNRLFGFHAPQNPQHIYETALCEYIENEFALFGSNKQKTLTVNVATEGDPMPQFSFSLSKSNFPGENRIIYGTPGCGKSHYLEHEILAKGKFKPENIFRTVFHPEYSNADFVGQILPVVNYEKNNSLEYSFVPGPFTEALIQAYENPNEKVALVIEEINRGNASAIFGEIFQLLDRFETDDETTNCPKGTSAYEITSIPIRNHLRRPDIPFKQVYSELQKIRIPANLFLFATMNSSDQNVFTLDTAFKRRWKLQKLSNTFSDDANSDDSDIGGRLIPGTEIKWRTFVEKINQYMDSDDNISFEDKYIGKYFINKENLAGTNEEEAILNTKKQEFASKVLEYLWSDVAKFNRERWFKADIKTLDKLLNDWNSSGLNIFNSELQGKLKG